MNLWFFSPPESSMILVYFTVILALEGEYSVSISKRIASISACWSSFQNTWQGFKVEIQEIRVWWTRINFFRNFHRLPLATSFNSKIVRLPIFRESEVMHEKVIVFSWWGSWSLLVSRISIRGVLVIKMQRRIRVNSERRLRVC